MHPVVQRLIHVKWGLFGKWGSARLLSINLYYTMIWTILGIFLVPDIGDGYYTPIDKCWWRILLELNGVGLTIYFMFMVSIFVFVCNTRWIIFDAQRLSVGQKVGSLFCVCMCRLRLSIVYVYNSSIVGSLPLPTWSMACSSWMGIAFEKNI